MSTSVNMILHMYIWFEGWFDDWVEGGLKLSLKGFQTKLFFFFIFEATTLSGLRLGLKVGLINLNAL